MPPRNSSLRFAAVLAAFLVGVPASGAIAAEAPYESRLVRLSEVLGSLHYLRNLCGEEGSQWRGQMEAILRSEDPDQERRARLVASFNHGYRAFDGTYATCTESAITAIGRYMREGEALSREIVTQFGN